MGSSYSKVKPKIPRTLPKSVQPSTTPNPNHKTANPWELRPKEPKGEYDNNKDLSLLANLRQIGQVNVEAPVTVRKTGEQILNMYEIRKISEQQAASSSPIPNCLSAPLLASLLDDRKFMNSRAEVEKLASRYSFDHSLLESLAMFVTTPSIGEGTITRTKNTKTGEERMAMTATWSEPLLKS